MWKKDNFSLRNVELHSIPERHPETGELESLKQKKWYIQGEKSLYVVIFSANDDKSYGKWVSKVESLTGKQTWDIRISIDAGWSVFHKKVHLYTFFIHTSVYINTLLLQRHNSVV